MKEEGTGALTEGERAFFQWILDEDKTVRISFGYLDSAGKAVITYGPLIGCEKHIRKADKHNCSVLMDFSFRDDPVKLGLTILTRKELREKELYTEETENLVLEKKEKSAEKVSEEERVKYIRLLCSDIKCWH